MKRLALTAVLLAALLLAFSGCEEKDALYYELDQDGAYVYGGDSLAAERLEELRGMFPPCEDETALEGSAWSGELERDVDYRVIETRGLDGKKYSFERAVYVFDNTKYNGWVSVSGYSGRGEFFCGYDNADESQWLAPSFDVFTCGYEALAAAAVSDYAADVAQNGVCTSYNQSDIIRTNNPRENDWRSNNGNNEGFAGCFGASPLWRGVPA